MITSALVCEMELRNLSYTDSDQYLVNQTHGKLPCVEELSFCDVDHSISQFRLLLLGGNTASHANDLQEKGRRLAKSH